MIKISISYNTINKSQFMKFKIMKRNYKDLVELSKKLKEKNKTFYNVNDVIRYLLNEEKEREKIILGR